MAKVLIDTDILSEILKGKNAAVAAEASAYLAEHGSLTTPAVTVAERLVLRLGTATRDTRSSNFDQRPWRATKGSSRHCPQSPTHCWIPAKVSSPNGVPE